MENFQYIWLYNEKETQERESGELTTSPTTAIRTREEDAMEGRQGRGFGWGEEERKLRVGAWINALNICFLR